MKRLKSPVPPWWRNVQWIFGIIATVLGAALPFLLNIPEVPGWVIEVVKLTIAVAAAIVGTAQFATADKYLK